MLSLTRTSELSRLFWAEISYVRYVPSCTANGLDVLALFEVCSQCYPRIRLRA